MNTIVGLDRDGTINVDLGTYVTKPSEFQLIPKSLEAIVMIKEKGYDIVIITNQAGIMKGIMTQDDVDSIHAYMLELFRQAGCKNINGIYNSTTNLKEDIYAKPNIGMFQQAEENLKASFKNGYYVGDKITDLVAASNVGATPVLVKTGYGKKTIEQLDTNMHLKKKAQVFNDLWAFAESLPYVNH
jgi:D-glycero-D-manno-heptose 1,7-bisphosphate phosphatase